MIETKTNISMVCVINNVMKLKNLRNLFYLRCLCVLSFTKINKALLDRRGHKESINVLVLEETFVDVLIGSRLKMKSTNVR